MDDDDINELFCRDQNDVGFGAIVLLLAAGVVVSIVIGGLLLFLG
jgi:hypothetical protein